MKNITPITVFFLVITGFTYAQTTYVPDDNFEYYLETHDSNGYTVNVGDADSMGNGTVNDNYVYTSRISDITQLNVQSNEISDLTGIEDFAALQKLYCYDNLLTSLDVTQNTNLEELYCYANQLTGLDVSQNVALIKLEVYANQLTSLNIQNGNNANLVLFNATGNSHDLTCVFVDDADYMAANWPDAIDATVRYVETQAECETTYVPDDNFEYYLETHDASGNVVAVGDANSMGNGIAYDDYVLTSKISNVTSLNVSNKSITDLTGITDFVALEYLDCSFNNQLTNLDVTQNTALKTLICEYDGLTNLDVSQNTDLQILKCDADGLTSLDISQNTVLEVLDCSNNALTSLNTSQNTVLQELNCYFNQLTSIDISQSTALQTLSCYNNQLTNIDISNNTLLQTLYCSYNQLTALDVTHNSALQTLRCYNNQLTALDVTQNPALQTLECDSNQLTSLNTSQNTALQMLKCSENQLTNLDVSQNSDLQVLWCYTNQLTSLNMQNGYNINLTEFQAVYNPDLTCVFVDNADYMNTNWPDAIDATATYAENQTQCDTLTQTTYVPDDNFENYLETHDATGNTVSVGDANSMGNGIANDDLVLTYKISNVTILNIDFKNIADLTGIADFAALQQLNCKFNQLVSLDVSQNTALQMLDCSVNQLTNLAIPQNTALQELYCEANQLTSLDITQNPALKILICYENELATLDLTQNTDLQQIECYNNQLTSLDITQNTTLQTLICYENQLNVLDLSQNPDLEQLECHYNQLTALDISQNPVLKRFYCFDNQLTSLNLQNGNNVNFTYFGASGNPDLTCVFVDDADYMTNNWSNAIDATARYVETQAECDAAYQTTYVPDDNFENYLETHDADGHTVQVGDANSMGNGIVNDDYVFTLKINPITILDVSSQNITDLTGITDFTSLQTLYCSDNQLTDFNLSQNTNLTALYCTDNQLTNLNISQNIALVRLYCSNNQLTDIDVSQNTSLSVLECFSNQLAHLDLRNANNTNITDFDTTGNPDLTCVFVDDAGYMTTNWSNAIDATANYVETQADCDALNMDETFKDEVKVYPNPFNGYINIEVPDESAIKSISIQNIQGQRLYEAPFSAIIKLSHLPSDLYFLNIENIEGYKAVFKLIKH